MTGLLVTGQLEPVKPTAVRSWFMRQGEGDLAALKTIGDAITVPTWVKSGGGTISSRRAVLTDDDIEKCIRDYVWRLVNFTGTLQGGAPSTGRAVDLHAYILANPTLNSSKGPTMDCGNIMYLYIGLLAAYGIPGRQTWCHRGSGNTSDVQAEYWSPEAGGWVRVMPHTNERDIWNTSGLGASMLDAVTVARQVGRIGKITQTAEGGSGGVAYRSGVAQDLTAYIDHCRWGRGNRLQFATGAPGDPSYTDYGGNRSTYIRFLDPTGSANSGTVTTAQASSVKARDVSDVAFTPSALMARARITPQGLGEVLLDAFMLDGVTTYQVKAPGGSWADLPNAGHTFYPVAADVWHYRAVGPLGNTTQTVAVTVA